MNSHQSIESTANRDITDAISQGATNKLFTLMNKNATIKSIASVEQLPDSNFILPIEKSLLNEFDQSPLALAIHCYRLSLTDFPYRTKHKQYRNIIVMLLTDPNVLIDDLALNELNELNDAMPYDLSLNILVNLCIEFAQGPFSFGSLIKLGEGLSQFGKGNEINFYLRTLNSIYENQTLSPYIISELKQLVSHCPAIAYEYYFLLAAITKEPAALNKAWEIISSSIDLSANRPTNQATWKKFFAILDLMSNQDLAAVSIETYLTYYMKHATTEAYSPSLTRKALSYLNAFYMKQADQHLPAALIADMLLVYKGCHEIELKNKLFSFFKIHISLDNNQFWLDITAALQESIFSCMDQAAFMCLYNQIKEMRSFKTPPILFKAISKLYFEAVKMLHDCELQIECCNEIMASPHDEMADLFSLCLDISLILFRNGLDDDSKHFYDRAAAYRCKTVALNQNEIFFCQHKLDLYLAQIKPNTINPDDLNVLIKQIALESSAKTLMHLYAKIYLITLNKEDLIRAGYRSQWIDMLNKRVLDQLDNLIKSNKVDTAIGRWYTLLLEQVSQTPIAGSALHPDAFILQAAKFQTSNSSIPAFVCEQVKKSGLDEKKLMSKIILGINQLPRFAAVEPPRSANKSVFFPSKLPPSASFSMELMTQPPVRNIQSSSHLPR